MNVAHLLGRGSLKVALDLRHDALDVLVRRLLLLVVLRQQSGLLVVQDIKFKEIF